MKGTEGNYKYAIQVNGYREVGGAHRPLYDISIINNNTNVGVVIRQMISYTINEEWLSRRHSDAVDNLEGIGSNCCLKGRTEYL